MRSETFMCQGFGNCFFERKIHKAIIHRYIFYDGKLLVLSYPFEVQVLLRVSYGQSPNMNNECTSA